MKHPVLAIKIFFVLSCIFIIVCEDRIRILGVFSLVFLILYAALFFLILSGFLKNESAQVIHRSGSLLIVSFFYLVLFLRFYFQVKGPFLPSDLFVKSSPSEWQAVLADVRIKKEISPGIYLADADLLQTECKKRFNKAAYSYNNTDKENRPDNHSHRQFGEKKKYKNTAHASNYDRKKYHRKNNKSTHRSQNNAYKFKKTKRRSHNKYRYKKQYRYGNKKKYINEWKKIKDFHIEKAPILIILKEKQLHSGCSGRMRFYGYSKIQIPGSDSFGNYIKKNGAALYSFSKSKTFLSLECNEPAFREKFRLSVQRLLSSSEGFTSRGRGAAMGMLFGKSGYLDRESKESVKKLGILHLFAASGLHLGIFYLCIYFPLSVIFGRRHPVSLLLPLPLCFVFLYLLYFPVSLSRAFAFLSIHALKSILHRRLSLYVFFLNTLIVLILFFPENTVSLSGLLSFSAVFGILFFYKSIREIAGLKGRGIREFVYSQAGISAAAGLLVSPILIVSFSFYSFSSLAANMIFVPAVSLILPILYFSTIAGLLFTGVIPEFFLDLSGRSIEYFLYASEVMKSCSFWMKYEYWFVFPLIVSFCLFFLLLFYRVLEPVKKTVWKKKLRLPFFVLIFLSGPAGFYFSNAVQKNPSGLLSSDELNKFFGTKDASDSCSPAVIMKNLNKNFIR